MKASETTSTAGSGRTSSGEPSSRASTAAPQPTPSNKKLDAEAYLLQQAEEAKLAMHQATLELLDHVKAAFDPRPLVKKHPWALAGIAAGAAIATAAAIPSRRRKKRRRREAMEREVDRRVRHIREAEEYDRPRGVSAKPGMTSRLFRSVLRMVKPALVSAVTAAVATKSTDGSGNGHVAEAPVEQG